MTSDKHRETAEKCTNEFRLIRDGCERDMIEIIAAALAQVEREGFREGMKCGLERGFLGGFAASGEGWNGEYPFDDMNENPLEDSHWMENRDKFIAAILAEAGEGA